MADPVTLFAFLESNPDLTVKLRATAAGRLLVDAVLSGPADVNIISPELSSAPYPAVSDQVVAGAPQTLGNAFVLSLVPCTLWELSIRPTSAGVAPLWLQLFDGPTLAKTLMPLTPGSPTACFDGIDLQFDVGCSVAISSTENVYTPVAGNVAELISAHVEPT